MYPNGTPVPEVVFQSTRPRRGATKNKRSNEPYSPVSIHAPPKGRDWQAGPPYVSRTRFQSTRPRRGATYGVNSDTDKGPCFNPRAPEGARPCRLSDTARQYLVSIHAPPKGRDLTTWKLTVEQCKVSIHAPPKGRDAKIFTVPSGGTVFQSTRPRRGATNLIHQIKISEKVSIHAPPKGRDGDNDKGPYLDIEFQSTRPRRGATSGEK